MSNQELSSLLAGCALLHNVAICYGCSSGDCNGCQEEDDLRTAIIAVIDSVRGSKAYYSAYFFSRKVDRNEDDVSDVLCDLVCEGMLDSWFSGHCWLYAVRQ